VNSASCAFDAYDPWGFIPGFASFDLPEGYTVNAESINLVDGIVPGAIAPEPGSPVLAGTGCTLILAFGFLLSRTKRTGAFR